MKKFALAVATAGLASMAPLAAANATTFDFENLTNGAQSSVSQTVDGLTVEIHALIGNFDVVSTPFTGFGNHSLISYDGGGFSGLGVPFIATFSTVVSNITLFGTDYTPSDNDNLWMQAWSNVKGTGTLLGVVVGPDCCSTDSTPVSVFLGLTGVRSLVFWEEPYGDFAGALYFDNLSVRSFDASGGVPEPRVWALMLTGFGLAGAALRRRRALATA